MSADLVAFVFDGREVRTVMIDGEPWFVAVDVCTGPPAEQLRRRSARYALQSGDSKHSIGEYLRTRVKSNRVIDRRCGD
jgi:hypothetical protein